jgi:hypothetical protein
MLVTTAPDGTEVRAIDEGQGPPLLILYQGLDDGHSWDKMAARLRPTSGRAPARSQLHRGVRAGRERERVDGTDPGSSIAPSHTVAVVRAASVRRRGNPRGHGGPPAPPD